MTISMIKLVSGETILAEVANEDETYLSVIDPIEVRTSIRNNIPVMISTIWMPLSKVVNLFHLKQTTIILSTMVDNDMEIYYNRCMETIREASSEDRSFLLDDKEDDMTQTEIDKVLAKIQLQGGLSANTVIH